MDIIKYCFCEESDTFFCYSLLKSGNLFHLYFTDNKIKYYPTNNNINPRKEKIEKQKLKFNKNIENFIIEGLVVDNVFFAIDIFYINNELVNKNYFTRYNLLKEFVNDFLDKNCFVKIMKIYYNYSLQSLLSNINNLQGNQIKPKYIYMKKNYQKYLINVKENEYTDKEKESKDIFKLKLNEDEIPCFKGKFKIFKTIKPEIYCIKIKDFYHVIRVSSLQKSKKLYELFKDNKNIELECAYSYFFNCFCY